LPGSFAVGENAIWVGLTGTEEVLRIGIPDGHATTSPVGPDPEPTVGAAGVWVASSDGKVRRLNSLTGEVDEIVPAGPSAADIAIADGDLWVTDPIRGTVSRIDPEREEVVATIDVGYSPIGLAAGAGGIWVAVGP
jgi:DNA-binding beta-propeller fold protein YncE